MSVNFSTLTIPYKDTGILSGLVADYLSAHKDLQPFYNHTPEWNGVEKAIANRDAYPINRAVLVSVLNEQYTHLPNIDKVQAHIDWLKDDNTYTVCTAHQPNLFTGPLYFIYKIAHAIQLAKEMSERFPQHRFVPVYYMGSEDADLEELGNVVVNGKKYTWNTPQQGAVGRMKVDKELLDLMQEMYAQLGVTKEGAEIVNIFKDAYVLNRTISEATIALVHRLFGQYGLVILNPDQPELKKVFLPIVEKELKDGFSFKAVQNTIEAFPAKYKVQAAGRPINLFYLEADIRARIDKKDDGLFSAEGLHEALSADELIQRFKDEPERCSPNVILRPVFQEMILPNVAFIGGGGELAYWLELKGVFDAAGVPYPMLVLRNSYLLLNQKDAVSFIRSGLSPAQMFAPLYALEQQYIQFTEGERVQISNEIDELDKLYQQVKNKSVVIDKTLEKHVDALAHKAQKKLQQLEKKLVARSKKMHAVDIQRLKKFKSKYFPNGSLQERVENLSGMYASYGANFIDAVCKHAKGLDMEFTILTAESNHHT